MGVRYKYMRLHNWFIIWGYDFKTLDSISHLPTSPSQPRQASQDDRILQLLEMCTYSLARAIELMDHNGLIMPESDAAAPWLSYSF
jgi:hypothetical protein